MQSQTKLLLCEMNKQLCDSQESMKASLEKNISISSSTVQLSESLKLGKQLGDISTSLGSLENKVASLEIFMKSKISEIEGRLDTYDNAMHGIKSEQLKSTKLCTQLTKLRNNVTKIAGAEK